jgi:hypothetical protein
MKNIVRIGALALLFVGSHAAWSQEKVQTQLFKVITDRDEIVIGLNETELKLIGGAGAGDVARALANKGELSVWQYAVKKGVNGDLQQAPHHKIGLLAKSAYRVEPYKSPLVVLPHE